MSTRFLVPSNVGPAGPPGPEGPEGPPGPSSDVIDDVGLPSSTKTRSSTYLSANYQSLLTTASSVSINQLSTNALSSLGAEITLAKNLAAGTNSIGASTISVNTLTSTSTSVAVSKALALGTNTVACGAATCTSLNTSNGNVNAGTGMVTASGGVVTSSLSCSSLTAPGSGITVNKPMALGLNTLTASTVACDYLSSLSATMVVDRDISMPLNDIQLNGLIAGSVSTPVLASSDTSMSVSCSLALGTNTMSASTVSVNTLTSTGASVAVSKALALGNNALSCGQVTSTVGNVKLSNGSTTDQAHIGFRATARPAANSRSYGLLRYNSNASVNPTAENKPFKLFYDQNNNVYGSTDPSTIQNQLEQATGAPLIIGDLTCGAIAGGGALTGVTANASIINAGTFAVARIPALPISQITGLSTLVDDIGVATSNLVVPIPAATPQWLTPLTFVKDTCGLNGAGLAMFSFRETTNGNANRCYSRMYQFSYRRSDFSGDSSSGTVTQIGADHNLSVGTLTLGAITLEDDKVNSTSPYQVRFSLASLVSTSSAVGYSVTVRIYGNVL